MIDMAMGGTQPMNLTGFAGGGIMLTPTWPIVGSPLGSASYIPKRLGVSGTMTNYAVIVVPTGVAGVWIVGNYTSGNFALLMQGQGGGAYVTCPKNQETLVYCDGTNAIMVGTNTASLFAVGDYKYTASPNGQAGWLICNGQSLPISSYTALWNAIGGYYGQVDGSHFNVPNLIGRVLAHADQNQGVVPGLNFAQYAGAWYNVLDISQIPSHNHGGGNHGHGAYDRGHLHGMAGQVLVPVTGPNAAFGNGWKFDYPTTAVGYADIVVNASGDTIGYQGGNAAHNNVQPSMGCYIFIYAGV
jgi:microcystin-dependent protein